MSDSISSFMDPLLEQFHKIDRLQRVERVQKLAGLDAFETSLLKGETNVPHEIAENLIENVIGYFPVPLGVASNFRIDGRDLLIPMAVEETSIIAAASATAKWVKSAGEIRTESRGRLIIGQIQIPRCNDLVTATSVLEREKSLVVDRCNALLPGLVARGGGVRDLVMREVPRDDGRGTMLVIHVLCDPCDAMGANLINQVCEGIKPVIERMTGEKVGLCILSNLVDGKRAFAEVVIRAIDPGLGAGIVEAAQFAKSDPYRAATHNKGVLNGIDPILLATGNDWRAVEAGVHAYASLSGKYGPVTEWALHRGDLIGRIDIPLAVGIVGGVTRTHPIARTVLKILGVTSADELARICAAVGLVQNLGALRALSTVGIVRGHMSLHATNLAIAAGANGSEVKEVSHRLREDLKAKRHISVSHAKSILENLRSSGHAEALQTP